MERRPRESERWSAKEQNNKQHIQRTQEETLSSKTLHQYSTEDQRPTGRSHSRDNVAWAANRRSSNRQGRAWPGALGHGCSGG